MFNDSRGPFSLLGSIALILLLASTFACNRSDNDKVVGGPDTGSSVFSLDPPSGVLASNGTYSEFVKVSWAAVSGAEAYTVFRTTSDTVTASDFIASNVKGYEYEDHSADLDVTYYYWVRAANGSALSALSSFATGYATRGDPNVAVPKDLDASDGDFKDEIELTWTCNDPTCTFNIYRNTENMAKTALLIESGLTEKSYTEVGVEANIDYYYWVTASEGDLEGTFGQEDAGYAAMPNLYIQSLSVPYAAYTGAQVTSKFSTAVVCGNDGRLDADNFTLKIYFSEDDILDENDTEIGNAPIGQLSAESFTIASGQMELAMYPASKTGLYYVIAVADVDDEVEEKEEADNALYHVYTLLNGLFVDDVDLAALSFTGYNVDVEETHGVQAGSYLYLRYAIANISTFDVDLNVTVYANTVLSNDLIINGDDSELGFDAFPGGSLPSGALWTMWWSNPWPYFIPHRAPGLYYIGTIIDSGNVVEELDEDNNKLHWPLIIDVETPTTGWEYPILEPAQ